MKDKTYCVNKDCKRKSCDKHLCHIKKKKGMVSVASFDGVCREYINGFIDYIEKGIEND